MTDAPASPAEGATPEATPAEKFVEQVPEPLGIEGKAALESERKARRDAEKQAKAATAELDKLRQATATDQEKAVMAAKAEGRTEALREAGIGRVEDAIRAAAGGRNVDIDALLDGVDRTKFLDDDGNPDRDAIQAWIDRLAPAEQEQGFRAPNLEQGTRTNGGTGGALALGSDPLTQTLKDKLGIR